MALKCNTIHERFKRRCQEMTKESKNLNDELDYLLKEFKASVKPGSACNPRTIARQKEIIDRMEFLNRQIEKLANEAVDLSMDSLELHLKAAGLR